LLPFTRMRVALTLLLTACGTDAGQPFPDAGDGMTTVLQVPLDRNLDLLFVVDDSGGMGPAQDALISTIPAFVDTLQSEGGLPGLHIGVVSPNLGAAGYSISGCDGDGDAGRLQSAPRGSCTGPAGNFVSDLPAADGTRFTNYVGTLTETLQCIAPLGFDGCGFEQHLEALRRAIDGSNPANAGFLRQPAALGVIVLANEDDCSVADPAMFDPAGSSPGSLTFRCTRYGISCDGAPPSEAEASFAACEPQRDSPYIHHPSEYIDFLTSLKGRELIFVAVLAGDPSPVNVALTDAGEPTLASSCTVEPDFWADPAVRLAWLVDAFAPRSLFASICGDMTEPMRRIAELALDIVRPTTCLVGPIPDPDSCRAHDAGLAGDTELPRCAANPAARPCFEISSDPPLCPETRTHLAISVERTTAPPPGTYLVVRCRG
jgi:hypothetical protein